ncbi:unnamed protein product [Rotaria magnacalcarata]|nr:unnamed protein product [Rotaria magnacalcarata]
MRPRNRSRNYLMIFRFDGQPQLSTLINNIDDWSLLCSSNISGDGIHKYFINNNRTAKHRFVIVGLRELNTSEVCSNKSLTPPITDQPFNFSADYELRTFTSACYYLDSNNNWQSDGLLVGPMTDHYQTQCFSTHLSTFTSGYSNVPNPVLLSNDRYFGRHCEITATKIVIYKIVSKSFAYIAIFALSITAMFILIMDRLKYCFNIDPAIEDLKRMRQEKRKHRVIERLIYVDATRQAFE